MPSITQELEIVNKIASAVNSYGGATYFVGGYVRDELMQVECKDIDIEVHGVPAQVLENILGSIGDKIEIGKSFGIYNIKGCSVDIAMPRKEKAVGRGHRDFAVDTDPFIGTENAARRRDFTVNALMKNVLTGEIVDHFGGLNDLKGGIIRHVCDKSFGEDPLRVLRAAQFAARFKFDIVPETVALCRNMALNELSAERVFEELRKALLKADFPSLFFVNLLHMDKLGDWFPETEKLIGVEQNKKYHAEGDVWTHTMMVLDEAAKRRSLVKNPIGFMLSALTHDFGKIVCTNTVDGVIHAYNHETEGLPLIKTFMRRITSENSLIKYVLNMAELHMKPNTMAAHKSSVKATNKLFDSSAEPLDLIQLALCDDLGKIGLAEQESSESFLMERYSVFQEFMSRPYVLGRDLLDAGLKPGEQFRELLDYAHKLRLAGVPKESALKQTLAYARKK